MLLKRGKPSCAWPTIELDRVPSDAEARQLASRVRQLLVGRNWLCEPVDLVAACRAGDVRLELRQLRAAQGGIEALLRPEGQAFAVTIDTEPRGGWAGVPAEVRGDVDRHRMRFRLAHELAHTFFYERTEDGMRRLVRNSDEQEQFCDLFASELLVPYDAVALMSAEASTVREVQRRFDVSMQVAARAVAAGHPEAAFWLLVGSPGGDLDLQWRSRASYAEGLSTAAAVAAAADGDRSEQATLRVTAMPERRQALVFATAA